MGEDAVPPERSEEPQLVVHRAEALQRVGRVRLVLAAARRDRLDEAVQLGVRRLGVKLLVGVPVKVGPGEEVGHRLCESGLATELWIGKIGISSVF